MAVTEPGHRGTVARRTGQRRKQIRLGHQADDPAVIDDNDRMRDVIRQSLDEAGCRSVRSSCYGFAHDRPDNAISLGNLSQADNSENMPAHIGHGQHANTVLEEQRAGFLRRRLRPDRDQVARHDILAARLRMASQ